KLMARDVMQRGHSVNALGLFPDLDLNRSPPPNRTKESKRKIKITSKSGRSGRGPVVRVELSAQHIDQCFDGQFHEQKRLRDEVIASTYYRTGPAFEIFQTGDEDHGRFLVRRQRAQFGA